MTPAREAGCARRCPGVSSTVNDRVVLSDDVWRYLPLGPLPTLIVGIAGLGLLLAVALRATPATRRLASVMLAITALAILAVTLSGSDVGLGRSVNLRPGAGIRAELDNVNHALGVVNVLGNVILFVPMGWLTAVLVLYEPSTDAMRGLRRGVLAGLALSVAIEMSQYMLGRAADVDDVLLNSAGALVGAMIGVALSTARRRHSSAAASHETEPLAQVSARARS